MISSKKIRQIKKLLRYFFSKPIHSRLLAYQRYSRGKKFAIRIFSFIFSNVPKARCIWVRNNDRNKENHLSMRSPLYFAFKISITAHKNKKNKAILEHFKFYEKSKIYVPRDTKGYYHFLTEDLPSLLLLEKLSASIFIHSDAQDYIFNLVNHYNLNYLKFESCTDHVLFADGSNIFDLTQKVKSKVGFYPIPSLINILRESTQTSLVSHTETINLYIYRDQSLDRSIFNHQEILDMVVALGFIAIDSAKLSISQQISYFSRSKIILGAHGAGLSNIIFSNKYNNSLLIELMPKAYQKWHYEAIADCLDIEYIQMLCDFSKNSYNSNSLVVSRYKLQELLQSLI